MWSNGSLYEGQFLNNLRHGIGKMKWKDGTTYEGEWFNGI